MKYPVFALVLLLLALAGCGGGSSGSGGCCGIGGINVQVVSPLPPAAVDDNNGLNVPITVAVTGDSSNAGVTWTVSPTEDGGPTGTLTNQQALTVTYVPPPGLNNTAQVIVTATSVTDPTRSAAIPISVYPPLAGATTSSSLATAFVNTDYTCILQPITPAGVTQVACEVGITGGLPPVTWSLGDTLLPVGLALAADNSPSSTCSPQTCTLISGIPVSTGVSLFTLTATDATGNSADLPLSISVAPAQLKVVTPTLMAPEPSIPYAPVQLQASGGVPPYTWSLATGSGPMPPGLTLSPSGTISGTPPPGFSGSFSFAVQVADTQAPVPAQAVFPAPVPAANGPKIITLGLGDSESLHPCQTVNTSIQANTPYAFVFTGFDADGPVTYSGSFTSDGSGNLSGVEDVIRSSSTQLAQPLVAGSSISFNELGRGCLTLATATQSGQFHLAPTSLNVFFTEGRMVEFDDLDGQGTRGTGYFHIQNSAAFSAPAAGNFAFRFSGWDVAANHFSMAGTGLASAGSLSSIAADVNDAGALSGALTGGGGNIGSADANGRGTATISVGSQSHNLIFYVLDANRLLFNSTQAASVAGPLITGESIAAAGPYSQATLNGSHIYRFGGEIPGSPDVGIGVLHFDGSAAVSGTAYERSGGTASATTVAAQYSVDPATGRVVFSGTATPVIGYATQAPTGITAFLVGTGSSAASGTMEFQNNTYPPGYQFGPIGGNYGVAAEEMLDAQTTVAAGLENPGPSGGLALSSAGAYLDSSGPTGLVPFQEFDMFKYTWIADGSGTYGGNTFMVTNQAKFFYIDVSPLNGHPVVVVGQLQQPPAITGFSPSCGPVGTSVQITGAFPTQLIGVTFNGVAAATFTLNSSSQVTATVPSGATTGPISITTPGGIAVSSSSFSVQSCSAKWARPKPLRRRSN